jgi:uncharacterized metal-binding protein
MSEEKSCSCGSVPKLIFACSGSADVGEITDKTARKLMRDGAGRMFCLAGIGGRVSGIMKSTESASKALAIDGCPLSCAKNCLEQAGFSDFEYLNLADIGMQKTKTEVNDENISIVAQKAAEKLSC